jgi:hypothetical protein
MIKSLLNFDEGTKRISRKQYNKELEEAGLRMDKGNSVSHKEALKELSEW